MSVVAKKFVIDPRWQVVLRDLGIAPQDVLRQARLPLDLFSREAPALSADEYFRFWDSVGRLLDDPLFPLRLGQAATVEAFSSPLFACFCSSDLNAALARLSQFKPLIGPLTLEVDLNDRATSDARADHPRIRQGQGLAGRCRSLCSLFWCRADRGVQ